MPMQSSKDSSTPPTSREAPLLDASLRAALLGLSLPVHRMVGALPGAHPGSGPGRGEDFFQHRPYGPGEDVRAVDWRASARLGHLLVKERHRPLRQPLALLLDSSDSMAFPVGGPSKHYRARQLAAALALLALGRGDPVRLDVLGPRGFVPAGRALPVGSAASAAEALLRHRLLTGRAEVGSALLSLSADALAGQHAVLLSDCYGDTDALLHGLERLVRTGAAVTVLHVLGQSDVHLGEGAQTLRDVETKLARAVASEEARTLGMRVEAWQAALRAGATHAGAEWVAVDAATLPGATLRRWLGGKGW
jgi:uncharacterized protein (DUF58 family)